MGFIWFYWVSLGFTGFYWVLLGFTGFYWVSLGFKGFYWVLLGFTGFHWVLLGFTGFYWVLLGFTGFYWVLPGTLARWFFSGCLTRSIGVTEGSSNPMTNRVAFRVESHWVLPSRQTLPSFFKIEFASLVFIHCSLFYWISAIFPVFDLLDMGFSWFY